MVEEQAVTVETTMEVPEVRAFKQLGGSDLKTNKGERDRYLLQDTIYSICKPYTLQTKDKPLMARITDGHTS